MCLWIFSAVKTVSLSPSRKCTSSSKNRNSSLWGTASRMIFCKCSPQSHVGRVMGSKHWTAIRTVTGTTYLEQKRVYAQIPVSNRPLHACQSHFCTPPPPLLSALSRKKRCTTNWSALTTSYILSALHVVVSFCSEIRFCDTVSDPKERNQVSSSFSRKRGRF